jgi:hypothetical protein
MSRSDECRDTGDRLSLRQTCRFLYQVDLLADIGNGIWVLIQSGSEPTDKYIYYYRVAKTVSQLCATLY